MSAPWEEIEVPRGAYIAWGTTPGQHVTGSVVDYSPDGGTDFNGNTCPQIVVELTEPAASINKAGDRSDFPAGEQVIVTAGLVSLKRALQVSKPAPGDLIKLLFSNTAKTAKGTVKEFSVKIARGAGKQPVAAAAPAQSSNPFGTDEPPF